MAKQTKHFLISNAWEAEEMMLHLMNQQDQVRKLRNEAAVKAANAVRQSQYDHYFCRVTIYDNQLIMLYRTADQVAEFMTMPK